MDPLDPRLNAYRPDLAAESLRGRVEVARFTAGWPAQVQRGTLDLRRRPSPEAPLDTQLLFGEAVTCFDEAEDWTWIQNRHDDYVGYVKTSGLRTEVFEASHRVGVLRTFIYPEPDLKVPPIDCLSMGSLVTVKGDNDGFSEIALGAAGNGWVYRAHLAARDAVASDYTGTALQFLGVPYLWGGKDSLGLDCSGLVQVVMAHAGIACQRDSDMQAETLGTALPWTYGETQPQYGDILYMPGHVAIALNETRVIHANAYHMMVAIEPLADLIERVARESERDPARVIDAARRPS